MRRNRLSTGMCLALGLVVGGLCVSMNAVAYTAVQELGDVELTVYAPDWTWQKRDINILLVARNHGARGSLIKATLELPETDSPDQPPRFVYDGETRKTFTVRPGGEVREAFTGITAMGGVPTGAYTFTIRLAGPDAAAMMRYPVKTIRGAAVNPGLWAVYLPVAVALVWCIVFAVALLRMAAPGAWRKQPPPIAPPENPPPWVDASPEEEGGIHG